MIFRKQKRMIDVRELQKRGVVRIPKQDTVIPTNQDGFIEFGTKPKPTTSDPSQPTNQQSNAELFGFMDTNSSAAAVPSQTTNRAESERVTELDNKIYKLEQRIELLEKKLDINQPTNNPVGVMGW